MRLELLLIFNVIKMLLVVVGHDKIKYKFDGSIKP